MYVRGESERHESGNAVEERTPRAAGWVARSVRRPCWREPTWPCYSIGRGFTLIELLVVIAIIGIILGFVLVAGMDAATAPNERATQTLITKLEGGLNDRLEALLETRPITTRPISPWPTIYSSNA